MQNNTLWKALQIRLTAHQHLFLKGIEVLTKANDFPKFELKSGKNGASSR